MSIPGSPSPSSDAAPPIPWAGLAPGSRPLVMGIVNVTPDSFANHGEHFDHPIALAHARALIKAGADILDIGGESTRPFAAPVPLDEELRRVIPVIQAIRAESAIPISIDTYKAPVARAALAAGADILNDISALRFDPDMAAVARDSRAPLILMHMQGAPRDMQANPRYQDLIGDIKAFFAERLGFALAHGLDRQRLVLDPGIGFGKTFAHNLEILNRLDAFLDFGCPLLIGPSRKAFIGHLLDLPPGQRDVGTLAAVALAVLKGAVIVRVHNVAFARQFFQVFTAIRQAPGAPA